MEIKIKLEVYDKYEAIYSWSGLKIFGREYSSDSFMWAFPKMDVLKYTKNNIDVAHILYNFEIPRFGESYKKYFEKIAKEELEVEIKKEMMKSINQQLLIELLFNNILEIGDK